MTDPIRTGEARWPEPEEIRHYVRKGDRMRAEHIAAAFRRLAAAVLRRRELPDAAAPRPRHAR